jgi:hypothetical protein
MKLYEINALFREGKDGRVYGLTLVDNRKCAVFNGGDLGKGYSGQALMKRFDVKPNVLMAGEKERHALTSQSSLNCRNFNSAIFPCRPGYMTLQKNS